MKNAIIITIALLTVSLTSCTPKQNKDRIENSLLEDSLRSVISKQENEINILKQTNPFVQLQYVQASNVIIKHYKPVGLTIELNAVRPVFNYKTYLCVPAAFTSPSKRIDGIFIKKGELISEPIHKGINGFIMFNEQDCEINSIKYLTAERIRVAINEGYNLFQQFLLVKKSKTVKCEIFGNSKNVRRAMIQYADENVFIVESQRPVSINDFQNALVEIGVVDALYLDMGSYSEGWYKSANCNKVKIGEIFSNTGRQTNWITFEKKTD